MFRSKIIAVVNYLCKIHSIEFSDRMIFYEWFTWYGNKHKCNNIINNNKHKSKHKCLLECNIKNIFAYISENKTELWLYGIDRPYTFWIFIKINFSLPIPVYNYFIILNIFKFFILSLSKSYVVIHFNFNYTKLLNLFNLN